jgi:2-acylglycerol O-acyltransferase 2
MSDIKADINNKKSTLTTKEWLIEARGMLTAWWIPFIVTFCLILFFAMASIPIIGLPLAGAYIVYMLVDKAHDGGDRRSDWLCSKIPVQTWMAEYFNLKIVKEAELDPKENYIFAYHPHGIISFGFQCAIYRFQNNFESFFKGIKISLLTLNMNFFIPFYRDYCLFGGMNSASKQSIKKILGKGPGHSVGLVVGGAAEAMYAKPDLARLVLKKRMGFVKLAIQTG